MITKFKLFFSGEKRTVKAKKNILASLIIKGIDSIVYLLLVPITLGFLNSYEYGIWLTLNSVLMWINSFDIGLGNGMRNKVTEAIATDNKELAQIYVSTTFIMLIMLMGIIILIGSTLSPLINWYAILGTNSTQIPNLDRIVYFTFLIFCLNFIFKFIGNVYLALQLPAINNLMITSGHLLSLIIIYTLTKLINGNLMIVAIIYSGCPLIIYLIAYPITFKKLFPYLSPSIHGFNRIYLKSLFNVSIQFFLLQISGILLFSFTNLLISHQFGPDKVTPYNISYRYFSIMPMIMTLIISPMWSATTDAFIKGDINWIKNIIKRFNRILGCAFIILFIMVCISKQTYSIWIGTEIHIPFQLSCLMACYIYILIVSLTYSNFINGVGKLRLQTITTVGMAICFFPLAHTLGEEWNINGIVVSMCILNLPGLILNIIQFNKLINNKANGIWGR